MSSLTLLLANDTNWVGDNITRDAHLRGMAQPNSIVTLLKDNVCIGEVSSDANGLYTFAPNLTDGLHQITARQEVSGSIQTAYIAIQIDTDAPTLAFLRINNGTNADLPIDTASGLILINAQALKGDIFLNVVSQGVETDGTIPLTGMISFSPEALETDQMVFTTSPVVRPFPNNPVGDGVMTSVIRAGGSTSALFQQYVPDGNYTIHVNVSDLAGNSAAEMKRSVIVDLHADTGDTATLQLNGPEAHVITKLSASATAFAVSGLDTDANALARFTDGTHTQSIFVGANGQFSIDLSGFSGTVSSSMTITDIHANTIAIAGNTVHALPSTNGDFDGAGTADLLWYNDSGTITIWQSTASGFTPNTYVGSTPGTGWTIQAQADFDGDGRTDIVWRSNSGALKIWHSDGTGFTPNADTDRLMGPAWHIAAVQDFSGDGKADILWRNDNGAFTVAHGSETGFISDVYVDASVSPTWKLIGSADFNADGKADLLWRNADIGLTTVWQSTGSGFQANTVVESGIARDWHLSATGDFDGDGRADLLLRNDSGTFGIRHATKCGFSALTQMDTSVATDWSVAKVSDFNGDGTDDLLWRHNDGTFTEWQSSGHAFIANTYADASVSNAWHLAANGFAIV